MCIYINSGLYLQMYSFLRNTQAIYQIILLLSDKTHLSGRKNLGWHLLQESALLYSSELISEICVRIDCRCSADYKSGSRRPGSGRVDIVMIFTRVFRSWVDLQY